MSALGLQPGLRLALSPRRRGSALPPIVESGLVAELRFDDGSGQQLTDYSGNANHGTLGTTGGADAADPAWATSPLRLEFDGGEVVVTEDISLTNEVHIELIARLDAASGDFGEPAAIYTGTNNGSPFQIMKNGANANLLWRVGHGDGRIDITGSADVWDGGWHHLVLDVEGVAGEVTVTAYVDDAADGNDSAANTDMASATNPLTLGARDDGLAQPFTGAEAYVLLYDRHLSAAERAQNREALVARMAARGVTLPDTGAAMSWSGGTTAAPGAAMAWFGGTTAAPGAPMDWFPGES